MALYKSDYNNNNNNNPICKAPECQKTSVALETYVALELLLLLFFLDPGTSFPRCETLSKVCELSG